MQEPRPGAPAFAVSGHNSTDLDYGRDAAGRPLATGLLVTPRPGAEPPDVKSGAFASVGRIERIVRNRRPGRPAIVWVEFPSPDDPDRTRRHGFREQDLLLADPAR